MTMSEKDKQFHLKAGRRAGEARTCGKKVDYKNEDTAEKSAIKMSAVYKRDMEHYPCCFCHGWHIGGRFKRDE